MGEVILSRRRRKRKLQWRVDSGKKDSKIIGECPGAEDWWGSAEAEISERKIWGHQNKANRDVKSKGREENPTRGNLGMWVQQRNYKKKGQITLRGGGGEVGVSAGSGRGT